MNGPIKKQADLLMKIMMPKEEGMTDLNDPKQAREFVKTLMVKENDKTKPLAVRLKDGRIVTGETATDDEIQMILASIAGHHD
jgi:hypothetical protein